MADKRKARAADAAARRARAAPTIDLTATEVPSEPPTAEPEIAEAGAPAADPAPQGTAEPVADASAASPPPPEQPAADETAAEPPPGPEEPPPPQPPQEKARRPGIGLPLAAGFAGGLIPAAILAGAWYGGTIPGSRPPDLAPRFAQAERQIATVRGDLAALQAQTKALAARADAGPSAPAADPSAVAALTQRVARLEADIENLPAVSAAAPTDAGLANRIAALETMEKTNGGVVAAIKNQVQQVAAASAQAQHQFDVTSTAVNQLAARVDDLARQRPAGVTPAQFEQLQNQVASLQQAAAAAQRQIAHNAAATAAARLALAATTLRSAVLGHAPYKAELAQAEALGANEKQLAPLQAFAGSGVPGNAELAARLRKLLPELTQIAAPQAAGSFLDRLRANAGQLVRITPANAPAGDEPPDVLARLSLAAAHDDVAAALAEIGKLPAAAQQKAAAWVAAAKAQQAALAAARALAAETARALGPG